MRTLLDSSSTSESFFFFFVQGTMNEMVAHTVFCGADEWDGDTHRFRDTGVLQAPAFVT